MICVGIGSQAIVLNHVEYRQDTCRHVKIAVIISKMAGLLPFYVQCIHQYIVDISGWKYAKLSLYYEIKTKK